jgi:sterol desaturase/sphingolipid hydroxylase (fatty acid hydroxylase superfamily)
VFFGLPLWIAVVYLTLSAANAQLEHANIRLSEGLDRWLRLLFVTPNMHKVHHSQLQPETDSNYANLFSIWDRIFGTYTRRVDFDALRYGLDDRTGRATFTGLLRMPF